MSMMRRLGSLGALLKELKEFAAANKAWWILPIFVLLLVVAGIISLGGSATPLIYTLF